MGHEKTNWCGAARATLAICLTALFTLAFTSLALALPTHPRKAALDISGLSHACGTAVDSKGNVYASSADESKVKVFDVAHAEIGSIANAKEPCGLAVDSQGNLYVSEKATGKVLRYHPTAFPFLGAPSYEAPITIDASGKAKGIAVDPFDNRLYVVQGDRVAVYNSDGTPVVESEVQHVNVAEPTGGTFTLSFEGQETAPIPYNATGGQIKTALEALSTVGAGNVEVQQSGTSYDVTFAGSLAATDVETLKADSSALVGGPGKAISVEETKKGFNGNVGEDELSNATGVAVYTYVSSSGFFNPEEDHYLFVADSAGAEPDRVDLFSGPSVKTLKLRKEIFGPQAGESFGFGSAGASLAVDRGNRSNEKCASIAEQACTAGHLLVYDDAHKAIDEFDASGHFLDQFSNPAFADAKPTAMAVDRSGGVNDGTIYVSAGAGSGAKLLAYGPLSPPSRAGVPQLSRVLATASAVTTDSYGNVYVRAGSLIRVFSSSGVEIKVGAGGQGIEDPLRPMDLATDSTGKVYVAEEGKTGFEGEYKVTYYTPSAYPPVNGTTYVRHEPLVTVDTDGTWPSFCSRPAAIAVNASNDHLFVTSGCAIHEYDSAAPGHESALLNGKFGSGSGFNPSALVSLGVDSATGNVYVGVNGSLGRVVVFNSAGTEVLSRITGAGSPKGPLGSTPIIGVDQSNGHVVAFDNTSIASEFDSSGAFLAEFGKFTILTRSAKIAVDSACALHNPPLTEATTPTCKEFDPANGTVYTAYDDTAKGTPDVTAFGPLAYGEPPAVVTGIASGLGAGNATLNGSVDPRGMEVSECTFEYLLDTQYITNGETFAGASSKPCAESLVEIGKGSAPISVHASVSGLNPEGRYRFRLVAGNKLGSSEGEALIFGPPVIATKTALPIFYTETSLRAKIDPAGLPTTYYFEYGKGPGEYDQQTPPEELSDKDGPTEVQAILTGLAEGTSYHFRVVAENESNVSTGPDQSFVTLVRRSMESCPNTEYRSGLSAKLPDCRAYELTTPAETNGLTPLAPSITGQGNGDAFSNWLVTPRGPGAGERLSYYTLGTLPGFEGNGLIDGYRAQRATGEGAHPTKGWSSELFAPSFVQAGAGEAAQRSVAADQMYSFWLISPDVTFTGTLPGGEYLNTPTGFEAVGEGSLGTDPAAVGRYISPGGAHIIFFSKAHLEEKAAPAGTRAIYDRAAGASNAEVISTQPDGSSFGAAENATYIASTEDGAAVVFEVAGTLYLHRAGQTFEIAEAPNSFGGISADGTHVFYSDSGSGDTPAGLFACETEGGSCSGVEASQEATEIAPQSIFVNVSPDGSHVFFTSKEAFTGTEENERGETAEGGKHNLYAWDIEASPIEFIGQLDAKDFESFNGRVDVAIDHWFRAVGIGATLGRSLSPTRSTPSGVVFVFQSHAQLTAYDNEGVGEIYRYDATAEAGERIVCVSCNPTGAPAGGDAMLADTKNGVESTTTIANVVDNGQEILFQSFDRLLPEDANNVNDVYQWKAKDAEGCQRDGGCLALISSGQGDRASYLYGMSADGHDVFFRTSEKLVGSDIPGSPSIYDARVNGGIPDSPAPAPCQGDACQGSGGGSPPLPSAATTGSGEGPAAVPSARRCPKGQRRVKGRCRAKKRHHRAHKRRSHSKAHERPANTSWRAGR